MAPFYVDTKVGRLLVVCVRYKEFAYEFLGVDEEGVFRRIGASACKFAGFYDEQAKINNVS
jgi:hypothetical protein